MAGRMTRKSDLPTKTCETCGRPFTWRKKWARDWDRVRYCSERCKRGRNTASTGRHEFQENEKV
jgi:hypothetical protein